MCNKHGFKKVELPQHNICWMPKLNINLKEGVIKCRKLNLPVSSNCNVRSRYSVSKEKENVCPPSSTWLLFTNRPKTATSICAQRMIRIYVKCFCFDFYQCFFNWLHSAHVKKKFDLSSKRGILIFKFLLFQVSIAIELINFMYLKIKKPLY